MRADRASACESGFKPQAMKQLLILRNPRHRAPGQSKLADYHHPLTRRGEIAAIAMGKAMLNHSYVPDLVICSSVTRARQTLAQIWPVLPQKPELVYDFRIHLLRGDGLLERLREVDPRFNRVLILSITPGISELAQLVHLQSGDVENSIAGGMPLGGLAVFDFDIASWRELTPASGKLIGIVS